MFSWINPMLLLGYHRPLEIRDLYATPADYNADTVTEKFDRYWKEELGNPK
jgi:hypothetical protein